MQERAEIRGFLTVPTPIAKEDGPMRTSPGEAGERAP
jgi:hypothetical protein